MGSPSNVSGIPSDSYSDLAGIPELLPRVRSDDSDSDFADMSGLLPPDAFGRRRNHDVDSESDLAGMPELLPRASDSSSDGSDMPDLLQRGFSESDSDSSSDMPDLLTDCSSSDEDSESSSNLPALL